MNCETCQELLVSYLYGELSETQAAELERALHDCPRCRAELRALRATGRAMAELPELELSAHGRANVLRAARLEADALGARRASVWGRIAVAFRHPAFGVVATVVLLVAGALVFDWVAGPPAGRDSAGVAETAVARNEEPPVPDPESLGDRGVERGAPSREMEADEEATAAAPSGPAAGEADEPTVETRQSVGARGGLADAPEEEEMALAPEPSAPPRPASRATAEQSPNEPGGAFEFEGHALGGATGSGAVVGSTSGSSAGYGAGRAGAGSTGPAANEAGPSADADGPSGAREGEAMADAAIAAPSSVAEPEQEQDELMAIAADAEAEREESTSRAERRAASRARESAEAAPSEAVPSAAPPVASHEEALTAAYAARAEGAHARAALFFEAWFAGASSTDPRLPASLYDGASSMVRAGREARALTLLRRLVTEFGAHPLSEDAAELIELLENEPALEEAPRLQSAPPVDALGEER